MHADHPAATGQRGSIRLILRAAQGHQRAVISVHALGGGGRPQIVHRLTDRLLPRDAIQVLRRLVPHHKAVVVLDRLQLHGGRNVLDDVMQQLHRQAAQFFVALARGDVARGATVAHKATQPVIHRPAADGDVAQLIVDQPGVLKIEEDLARLQHLAVLVPAHTEGRGAGHLPAALAQAAVEVRRARRRRVAACKLDKTKLLVLLPVPVGRNRRQAAKTRLAFAQRLFRACPAFELAAQAFIEPLQFQDFLLKESVGLWRFGSFLHRIRQIFLQHKAVFRAHEEPGQVGCQAPSGAQNQQSIVSGGAHPGQSFWPAGRGRPLWVR